LVGVPVLADVAPPGDIWTADAPAGAVGTIALLGAAGGAGCGLDIGTSAAVGWDAVASMILAACAGASGAVGPSVGTDCGAAGAACSIGGGGSGPRASVGAPATVPLDEKPGAGGTCAGARPMRSVSTCRISPPGSNALPPRECAAALPRTAALLTSCMRPSVAAWLGEVMSVDPTLRRPRATFTVGQLALLTNSPTSSTDEARRPSDRRVPRGKVSEPPGRLKGAVVTDA